MLLFIFRICYMMAPLYWRISSWTGIWILRKSCLAIELFSIGTDINADLIHLKHKDLNGRHSFSDTVGFSRFSLPDYSSTYTEYFNKQQSYLKFKLQCSRDSPLQSLVRTTRAIIVINCPSFYRRKNTDKLALQSAWKPGFWKFAYVSLKWWTIDFVGHNNMR